MSWKITERTDGDETSYVIKMCRGDTPTFRINVKKNTVDGALDWEPTQGLDYDLVFAIKERGGESPLY